MPQTLHFIYHELSPAPVAYSYTVPCSLFCEHLAVMAAARESDRMYQPVITFDDGHKSQFQHALPLLAKYSVTATFFITTGWIGHKAESMSASEIRQLAALGHRIGSHSMSHPLLTHCSPAELQRELSGSKQQLEDCLGQPVTTLSLPGGRYNPSVLQACAAAGYKEVFSSDPILEPRNRHGIRITGRLNIDQTVTAEHLEQLLNPAAGALAARERRARLKIAVRRLTGDRVYEWLWSVATRHG